MMKKLEDDMQYTFLGRTGLRVSRIGLGTMNFGEFTGEADSFHIMNEAIDADVNFFDTAGVYGGPQSPDMAKGYGVSEETGPFIFIHSAAELQVRLRSNTP